MGAVRCRRPTLGTNGMGSSSLGGDIYRRVPERRTSGGDPWRVWNPDCEPRFLRAEPTRAQRDDRRLLRGKLRRAFAARVQALRSGECDQALVGG